MAAVKIDWSETRRHQSERSVRNAQRRLRRAVEQIVERQYDDPMCPVHLGANLYTTNQDGQDLHALARRLMVCSGTTFNYEIVRR